MRNIFILILILLVLSCSSSTSKPAESITPVQKPEPVEVNIPSVIEESAGSLDISVNAAQSVINEVLNEKVDWQEFDYDRMLELARSGEFVFVYFYSEYCEACKKTDNKVFSDKYIVSMLNKHFYPMKANIDDFPEYLPLFSDEKTGLIITPTELIVLPNGAAIKIVGYLTLKEFSLVIRKIVSVKNGWTTIGR